VLQQETRKLEAIVRQFKNSNSEYAKIRKTTEEKVSNSLSNGKDVLKLALFFFNRINEEEP
jgi:hypothetical protein